MRKDHIACVGSMKVGATKWPVVYIPDRRASGIPTPLRVDRSDEENHVVAAEFGTGQVLWSMIWFTLFFIWIWLLIVVFGDIFRSHDLGGWSKAIWILFIIVVPLIAILIYLIVRGDKMRVHAMEAAKEQDEAAQAYIRQAAGTTSSPADELHRLADLKDRGVIDQAEFDRLKAKVIAD